MTKLFVKKGDRVTVIAGKERGKSGKVLRTFPKVNRVIVEGLNMTKKATRQSQKNPKGGIIIREGPINVSSIALYCPSCDRPTRVGYRRTDEGQRIRFCKHCATDLDKE